MSRTSAARSATDIRWSGAVAPNATRNTRMRARAEATLSAISCISGDCAGVGWPPISISSTPLPIAPSGETRSWHRRDATSAAIRSAGMHG